MSRRRDKRQMAYTAAAMYGGAAFLSMVEGAIPGGPALSLIPGVAAMVLVALIVTVGPRLPASALATLGPIGATLIAYAIATTPSGQGDGVLLYIWPVLWMAYFFGRRASVLIVAWIGVVQGVALIHLHGVLDRWIDLVVSVGIVAVVVQVLSERNDRLVARLAAEARVDKLTGVLNRRGFEERAAIEVERARREGYPVGVASFDIDYFKRVNDEWGHDAGDRVLERLGAVFGTESRSVDIVGRLGGEEFVALLPSSDAEATLAYAERIRAAFATSVDREVSNVTVSAGVIATVGPAGADELLQAADSALYAAKRGGRNRAVLHDQALASTSPLKNSMSAL
jgi:diguanylate cyclase (GGDEF)-like protein